jgi:hypothetical protein
MSEKIHVVMLSFPLLVAACGNDGGASASDGMSASGSSTASASESSGGPGPTTGSGSVSDSATSDTVGSISDSQASMSGPTTGAVSETGSTSTTSSTGSGDSDATSGTTGQVSGTTGGSGTTTGDTGEDTSTGGGPDYCRDMPPPPDAVASNECEIPPKVGVFKPVVEWKKAAWAEQASSNCVFGPPVVAPLTDDDGDGVFGSAGDMPSIVVVTYVHAANFAQVGNGLLRVVSGDGMKELFTVAGQGLQGYSGAAVGDLDGDGAPEIVAHTAANTIKAFSRTGVLLWTSAAYPGEIAGGVHSVTFPAIADMDGDGKAEVISGRVILNHDGSLRGKGALGVGSWGYGSASVPVDIDGDGIQEVIVGNAAYRPNGTTLWANGQPDGYPGIADFDGDGKPEIVVVGFGTVRLQGADGKVLWSVANASQGGGPPTIADFDGDGKPEIGVAGNTSYRMFDTDGKVLWSNPTVDTTSGFTGSSVYDFEGDGVADIVYADEQNLFVFAGNDGAMKLKYEPHNSASAVEYPVIADVDNDGQVEIVLGHNVWVGGATTGITVLGDEDKSWRPGRKIWNQHAYSITNVDDHGGIPAKVDPNWKIYNNFRSGDLSPPDGLSAPDLVMVAPDTCVNDCVDPDIANLYVQLGNVGGVPLVGAVIEVYGTSGGVEKLLFTQEVAGPLAAGVLQAAVAVATATTGLDEIRLVAVAKEAECVIDAANELVFAPPFCAP